MNRITIESWLWLGNELKDNFESPPEMRSIGEEMIKDGTTIRQLLADLARRYPVFSEKVFDIEKEKLYPYVVVNYNDQVISPHVVHDQVLKDGDKITILPMYMGGQV